MTTWLFLGAKEYPFGHGRAGDKLPSGGFEKYAEKLAHALAERGDKVHLVTRRFRHTKSPKPPKNVFVHRVPWISGTLLRNPSFNMMALKKAAGLDFDVVLTQGPMAAAAAHFLKMVKSKPVIAVPAGVAFGQPQYGAALNHALKTLERFAYRRADAVVFLSEAEKNQFQKKLGFLPARSTVIAPGVDVPKKAMKTSGKKPRLLFVGRLVAVKGADVLLHAMAHLDNKLDIVGDGPEREKLEQLARTLLLKNVHFHGYRDPEAFLKKAGVFVLPSVSEGLPMALLEAAANGLACVVTNIGLPFENGKEALVVPSKNPVALAEAVRKLNDARLRVRMGKNARAFVAKNHSWKKSAAGFDALAQALQAKTRAGGHP